AIARERQAAERALRASEERLAGIVSLAADAILSIDEAQRTVMFNTGAETLFGWSQGEVLGEPVDLLRPERVRELHGQHLGRFAAANETARQMGARRPGILGRRKSGEEFPAEAAISKLKIDGGWVFTAILRDISEHVRIEHEEHYLA